ncbi:MAG TPA: hypothetical protein VK817_06110 [Trebonia sp.]|nr:hypothetical protein [Trebonia sp.]
MTENDQHAGLGPSGVPYCAQWESSALVIYAPFARMAAAEFGVGVDVARELTIGEIAAAATPDTPVVASVHRWIRWPDRNPPERGGHLVLVTGALPAGAGAGALRLHNPSGFPGASQRDVMVQVTDFAKFFAGRGMLVR